jgi:tripartite-type tricarboxylate transporter receptor subunit TctC
MAKVVTLAGLILSFTLACHGAIAQDSHPSKPVRIMVSFAAGGPTDQVARIMSAKLTELLGQTFLVENRTGAGDNIGAADVAKSPPDGYTPADGHGLHARHQSGPVQEHAVRPGKGLRARRAGRGHAVRAGGASVSTGDRR